MGYDIKSIKQEFKDKGIFYTPPELSLFMRSFLPDNIEEVYDPTCGEGSLLNVFEDNVIKYGQDIEEKQVENAKKKLKNFIGASGDTLTNPAFKDKKFKYILANPPFSIKWQHITDERFIGYPALPPESKADYAFIMHILHYLKQDGIAVVMGFPGILYRGRKEGEIRKYLVEKNLIEKVIYIPGDKFVDTKIATCIIVFNKSKKDNSVLFIDDENKIERVVEFKEIEKNDFNLSVQQYIQKEKQIVKVDPFQLEKNARKQFLHKMKKEIEFSKMVANFENYNFNEFLEEIQQLLNTYKN